jgi:hypothetical protein
LYLVGKGIKSSRKKPNILKGTQISHHYLFGAAEMIVYLQMLVASFSEIGAYCFEGLVFRDWFLASLF